MLLFDTNYFNNGEPKVKHKNIPPIYPSKVHRSRSMKQVCFFSEALRRKALISYQIFNFNRVIFKVTTLLRKSLSTEKKKYTWISIMRLCWLNAWKKRSKYIVTQWLRRVPIFFTPPLAQVVVLYGIPLTSYFHFLWTMSILIYSLLVLGMPPISCPQRERSMRKKK